MKRIAVLMMAVALYACPKNTADLELEAAMKAIDEARAGKANDCAKETYQAAEAAIAEARQLAEDGEVDAAKEKANQAKSLAEQAQAASKPGCDQVAEEEDISDPEANAMTDASATLDLAGALETIYFDYNDATIREDSKAVLSRVATVLTKTPAENIEIEGHCDVRGSTEYNLHLGERRARSVSKYLVAQGVNEKQIHIISYGEERPIDLGGSESAHQKNRRAELKKM
ncbi:MAG: OmpA family protein [Deltaproteobacteria bacterium]|jgi:peptidoglycan-associated lipoprotein